MNICFQIDIRPQYEEVLTKDISANSVVVNGNGLRLL